MKQITTTGFEYQYYPPRKKIEIAKDFQSAENNQQRRILSVEARKSGYNKLADEFDIEILTCSFIARTHSLKQWDDNFNGE